MKGRLRSPGGDKTRKQAEDLTLPEMMESSGKSLEGKAGTL